MARIFRIAGFILFAASIYYAYRAFSAINFGLGWTRVLGLAWWQIGVIAMMPIASFVLAALRWKTILAILGDEASTITLTEGTIMAPTCSYFMPWLDWLGKTVRFIIVQKKTSATPSSNLLSIPLDNLFAHFFDLFLALGLIAAFNITSYFGKYELILFFILSALYALIYLLPVINLERLVCFSEKLLLHRLPIPKFIRTWLNAWFEKIYPTLQKLFKDLRVNEGQIKKHFLKLLIYTAPTSILIFAASLFEFKVLSLVLGLNLPWKDVSILYIYVSIARTISALSFAPGGAGIMDIAFPNAFSIMGYPSVGFASAFIILFRFKEIVWIGIGFVLIYVNGLGHLLSSSIAKNKNNPR